MRTLPINLNVEGRTGLVVGGGAIALAKARALMAAGMRVRVVAPFVLREIEELPGITVRRRPFREEDLEGIALVIAATDDDELNHKIHAVGQERGLPVNCVDDPDWCDFIFPSILRRGELAVAVSTGGGSPALARLVRQWLERALDGDFGQALELAAEMRRQARRRVECPGARRAVNECVARMALKAIGGAPADLRRRMEEVVALAEGPAPITTRIALGEAASQTPTEGSGGISDENVHRRGRVTLVGAGPGDPELLTLAGVRALAEADLVIYDRLVNPALLEHAPRATRVYCGKTPGLSHEEDQERINRLMVEEARAGRRVVRLKGGDPFIFGRGGEEILAARAAGLDARVIPGITAALGAAAACELPLTHRRLAASVAFVTGCSAAATPRPEINWRAMAQAVDTLALYMGVRHLAAIARELIAGGRPADEPAAAIQHATTPEQKVHYFTLEELGRGMAEGTVEAPAVIVIGQVVHLQRELEALARQALAQV